MDEKGQIREVSPVPSIGYEDLVHFIQEQEPEIIILMQGGNKDKSLSEISQLACPDITYLLAYKVKEKFNGSINIFALDGRGKGLTTADGHLVLGLETDQGLIYIDGTIWQVNPDEKHIRIKGPYRTEQELFSSLEQEYGGSWRRVAIPDGFMTTEGAEETKKSILLRARARELEKE